MIIESIVITCSSFDHIGRKPENFIPIQYSSEQLILLF